SCSSKPWRLRITRSRVCAGVARSAGFFRAVSTPGASPSRQYWSSCSNALTHFKSVRKTGYSLLLALAQHSRCSGMYVTLIPRSAASDSPSPRGRGLGVRASLTATDLPDFKRILWEVKRLVLKHVTRLHHLKENWLLSNESYL